MTSSNRPNILRRAAVKIQNRVRSEWDLRQLSKMNRSSRRPIVHAGGPVMSLTTYGARLQTVHLTIESIARGTILPSRFILWVDDPALLEQLPAPILSLMERGLEVTLTQNYGPHTKYYPYVKAEARFAVPVVIGDDDIVYPRRWLEGLVQAFESGPDVINCYLAKRILLDREAMAPYAKWPICRSKRESFLNVAHGVNGVIFAPRFLSVLREAGEGFLEVCPKADDLWLHVHAIRAGYRVRQVVDRATRFPAIPGTQEGGLWQYNNAIGNDMQARNIYSASDLKFLHEENVRETERHPIASTAQV